MSSRDNILWLQCWRDRQLDFHQPTVNHFLTRFWPGLDLALGSRVFVPLCGKSLDMIWLAERGHHVVGVELSPIAVAEFFRENGLRPSRRRVGQFMLWQHGRISILCGDYFALKPSDLGEIETVYDRAALTALPEDIRRRYVSHLRTIAPETSRIFLLTTEDAAENETLSESLAIGEEITALYAKNFRIDLTHIESVFEIDPAAPERPAERAEYKLYSLSNRSAA